MTARDVVLEQIDALPVEALVIPYGRKLENVSGPTLMVRVDRVVPDPDVRVWRRYSIGLLVIVPYTDPEKAEDELDKLMEDVLHELEKDTTPLVWSAAERGSFQESWPCYEITLSVPINKES